MISATLSTTFNSKCKNGRQGRGADEEEDKYILVRSRGKRQYVKVRETQDTVWMNEGDVYWCNWNDKVHGTMAAFK